jgi:hypothetical protein
VPFTMWGAQATTVSLRTSRPRNTDATLPSIAS